MSRPEERGYERSSQRTNGCLEWARGDWCEHPVLWAVHGGCLCLSTVVQAMRQNQGRGTHNARYVHANCDSSMKARRESSCRPGHCRFSKMSKYPSVYAKHGETSCCGATRLEREARGTTRAETECKSSAFRARPRLCSECALRRDECRRPCETYTCPLQYE